ncbi:Hydroxymethylpyrimidine pyrophosphatase [Streptomyces sp. SolWspMP-5a-2]|nr:Hydroxymethylpyrimidine pyrophosphatase [Streptomyces sp. SolWspMP-5a-2]
MGHFVPMAHRGPRVHSTRECRPIVAVSPAFSPRPPNVPGDGPEFSPPGEDPAPHRPDPDPAGRHAISTDFPDLTGPATEDPAPAAPRQSGVPRYAAFDLDGTLLDAEGRIPRATVAGIARLRGRGLLPVLVTGRSLPSFRRWRDADRVLDLCHPEVLLEEGDLVYDRGQDRHRAVAALPADAVARVRRACADVVASCDGRLLASTRRAAVAYAVAHGVPRDAIGIGPPTGPSTRLMVFGEKPPEPPGTEGRALRGFGATLLTAAGRGKAVGLAALLTDRFGERDGLSRVVAFGDGDNDAGLLAGARLGIAVQGSSPAARAAADLCLDRPLEEYLATTDLAGPDPTDRS